VKATFQTLNAILYEDRIELTRARIAEDNRMVEVTGKYDETALRGLYSYRTTSGMPQSQVLADILLHLFNHQTHHRGQAHACLSILTGGEPPSLDLLAFQRGGAAPNLEKLIASKPADFKKDKVGDDRRGPKSRSKGFALAVASPSCELRRR